MLEIIQDTKASASFHMAVDRALLMKGNQHPRLRFYEWDGLAITAGIFSDPEALLDIPACRQRKIDIAKRPTGGGILFHGSDLALTLFIPAQALQGGVEEWCRKINQRLLKSLAPFLPVEEGTECERSKERCRFCMSQVTDFDLIWNGKKIGGCAQRRTRTGLLHQASMFISSPDWERIIPCVRKVEDVQAMQQASVPLDHLANPLIARSMIQDSIMNTFLDWKIV